MLAFLKPPQSGRMTADASPGPLRTCIGCRGRSVTDGLLRIVALPVGDPDGGPRTLVVDLRHRLGGRGAWLHPTVECLALAEKRRAFGRALRLDGQVDISALQSTFRSTSRK